MINKVILGDCLERLAELPDNSVDLICTDPPYYRVKAEWWDRQWDKPEGFLEWLDRIAEQWQRILKPNGSLYCFASSKMSARVEVKLGDRFNVLNNIRWVKEAGWHQKAEKEEARKYQNPWEAIVFCEHQNIHKDDSLYYASWVGSILRHHRKNAGISTDELAKLFPSASGGLTGAVRNWELGNNTPTWEQWKKLQSVLKELPDYGDVVRPFNVSADVPYTDVWSFPTVSSYPGKHPCEKPMQMLEHIIRASSKPGAVVLDCFAGSGNTLIAAKNLGRQFIGIEIDPHWVNVINQKLGKFDTHKPTLEERVQWLETQVKANASKLRKIEKEASQQLDLFA